MLFGVGTDIIEISRIKNVVFKKNAILNRLFTDKELEYYKSKKMNIQSIASGFAAKEAVLKALGTELGMFKWKEIEVFRSSEGKPLIIFYSSVKEFVEQKGIGTIHITISHSKQYATATAVAEVSIEREGIVIENLLLQSNEDIRRNIH